jgi:multisubunit Na+/H+ antiporter MnhB subunit
VEILTIVFFAAVILRTTHTDTTVGRGLKQELIFPAVVYGGFSLLFMVLAWRVFSELPAFGDPVMRVASSYIAVGLRQTGAANLVAAVILDFRAYDTLGEAVVLFTAVVGVLTVVRRLGRKADKNPEKN